MTSPFRLLIVADVGGQETRHIGDEAMLEANLDGLRKRIPAVAFTAVSRDPAWTAARYGIDAVAPFGFPGEPSAAAQRAAMLARLVADARSERQANATVAAVIGADAVVVSGGGNLSSSWPDLLYERAALLHLARQFGKPAVVLGQTLGPRLSGDERQLLAETLSYARFVGLRELPSAALALDLGIPAQRLWYQCDDALLIDPMAETDAMAAHAAVPTLAITIDPQIRAASAATFNALVIQLRELARTTGASLVLVPHAFGNESAGTPSDLTEARILAERLGLAQTVIAADLDARGAHRIARDAALVISSRYHPIVFGLASGVAALGIHADEYCRIKLQGALAHAGLDRWTLDYDDVANGMLLPRALELWQNRKDVRRALVLRRDAWCKEASERWIAIGRALDPNSATPLLHKSTLFGRPVEDVAPALAGALEARRKAWERQHERAEQSVRGLHAELGPGPTIRRYAAALLRRLGLHSA